MISQFPQCTEKWIKSREILSWRNSELEPPESSLPPTCWQEVLMSSRLVLLSTTSFLSRRKTTSIESVELVDSEERVSPLTSSHQTTLDSSERSRIIITLKSKKCPRIWRNSTPPVLNEDPRSILRINRPIWMELYNMSSFYRIKSLFYYWMGHEICDNMFCTIVLKVYLASMCKVWRTIILWCLDKWLSRVRNPIGSHHE